MDFLKELYLGNVFPADQQICRNAEYKKTMRACTQQYDAFKKELSEPEIERLSAILQVHTRLLAIQDEESFKLGFRLGVQMMCACFYGDDVT